MSLLETSSFQNRFGSCATGVHLGPGMGLLLFFVLYVVHVVVLYIALGV